MRERLIELLEQCSCHRSPPCTGECHECHNVEMFDKEIEHIADHLLANGVIVPPCKVGDVVFEIVDMKNSHKAFDNFVWSDTITKIGVTTKGILHEKGIDFADFGKTVFLSREEAEKALKERSEKE